MTDFAAALTEIREARGLSVQDLADELEVRRETVYKWERGAAVPSNESFLDLLRILDVPPKFFQLQQPAESAQPIFYRSLRSVRKSAEVRTANRRLAWLREIVTSLERFVVFPNVHLPTARAVSDPFDIQPDEIETAAIATRHSWGLGEGPIDAVSTLLDNAGIIVCRNHLDVTAIDAFSQHGAEEGRPVVVLANDDATGAHIQADCAHELGHLVMHGWLDKHCMQDRERYAALEEQAWRFARAFLLPADAFKATVRDVSLDHLVQLKLSWHVSVGLMLKRCEDLQLVSDQKARQLWINRQNRRWTKSEPFDDALAPTEPRLLREAVEAILEGGSPVVRAWLDSMRLGVRDVARFIAVDPERLLAAGAISTAKPRLREEGAS
jgi:Zn-dependent peptidase ImmA (M78 family)/transcriptional regulator with XRE-family HTH domain